MSMGSASGRSTLSSSSSMGTFAIVSPASHPVPPKTKAAPGPSPVLNACDATDNISNVTSEATSAAFSEFSVVYWWINVTDTPWHQAVMIQFVALVLDGPCLLLFCLVVITGYRASLLCSQLQAIGWQGVSFTSTSTSHLSLSRVLKPHRAVLEQCAQLLTDLGCLLLVIPIVIAGRRRELITGLASCASAGDLESGAFAGRSAVFKARRDVVVSFFRELTITEDNLPPPGHPWAMRAPSA